ncbi:DUF4402 domain-containing protein [Dehalobacter sp. TeCB1]|jgi:hypothetical protein|uniref:DUF4402 domain-containing protein n=1 Tax=Dehalobacter sp. TeCB1 TaxID=1843715 RepID=UPI000AEF9267|nr:DUF4402 domain-containing protein [Dehalobacter sp. TeCB1]
MANTIEYAKIFQTELDTAMVAGATSGWMELNSDMVKYNGGNEVKIPKVVMDGMADYDRENGFVKGSVTLSYETHTLSQDRGRTFGLDAMDVNETNFVLNAATLMGEFQNTRVIPEVDAYRYSKIATKAIAGSKATGGYTPVTADIMDKLLADVYKVYDKVGEGTPLVISLNMSVAPILDLSDKITKRLNVVDFQKGEIAMKTLALDGIPIIRVPSARMKTSFAFNNGTTTGQEAGGFLPVAKASVTIGGVKYEAASAGLAGNAYTVTIVQGTGASVATAGVIDATGKLTITLGTNSSSAALSVTATQIAALTFTGDGASLITATAITGSTVQSASASKSLAGGAGSGDVAKTINWLITARKSAIAVSKTDVPRIFDPMTNQTANAWKIDYRKYHDLFIPDNKVDGIYVNVQEELV